MRSPLDRARAADDRERAAEAWPQGRASTDVQA